MKSTMPSYVEKLAEWVCKRKWVLFSVIVVVPVIATGINKVIAGENYFAGLGDYVEIAVEMVALGAISIFVSNLITSKARVVKTGSESEERYHQLFDLAPDPIVVHKDGTILLANEAAAKSLGLGGAQDLIGKSLLEVIDPNCHAHVNEAIASVDEQGLPPMVEIPFVRLDGKIVYGETTTAHTVYNGEPALVSVARDVTESKLAERALRESEKKYRLVVDNAREGIFIVQDGAIQFMNSRVPWFMKREESNFEKKPFIEFVHPEDREAVIQQHMRRMQGDQSTWCRSLRVITNEGDVQWLELTSLAITWEGKPAALCFAADVTERRQTEHALRESEKRYRELVNNAIDGIYLTDANGFFRMFNPIGLQLTGYTEEEILHSHYLDLVHPDHRKEVERFYGIQFVKKTPSSYYELPICSKNGQTIWLGQHVQLVMEGDTITGFQAICRDITERKRAQEDLRRAEESLRIMVENLPIAVFAKSAEDHRFISWNKASEDLFGLASEDVIGKNDYDLFPKEQADFFCEKDREALDSGVVIDIPEEPILTKDRGIRILHTRKVPLQGKGGTPHTLLGISEDITERKKSEEALRESERRYRRLFEDAPLMSVITRNEQGIPFITDCNEFFLRSVGCTREEVVGRPLGDYYSPASQSDLLEGGGYARSLAGEFAIGERELVNRDGSLIPTLLYTATEVDSSEKVTGTRAMFVDITERKHAERALAESEERFRSLFECAADLIQILSPTGTILQTNPATHRLLGYTEEELVGRPVVDLFDSESQGVFHDYFLVAIAHGTCNAEVQMRRKDGTTLAVDCSGAAVRSENSGLRYLVLMQRDITERRRAENALRESEERFRAIFESVPNSVFIKNRSRQYDLVNPAMLELLALPDSAVLGRTEEEIFGADMAEQLNELDQRVLSGDRIEEERKVAIAGVPMTFLETRVPLRDSAGRVTGICGISHNITERKHYQNSSNPFKSKNLSKTMRATFQIAEIAGGHDSIVLITGESGVGKDYLAKYIHAHSKRSKGPYFSINCAAVPVELAESELFGHEAGSFTGAGRRKRGLIELAEGGTLLLNEVGELSPPIQAKLLTFLDTRTFHRVGGERAIKVNVRLIAATSRDLQQDVAEKRFRADLFYRLNVFNIRIPPLRDRRDDIPSLALALVRELGVELQLPNMPIIGETAMISLRRYSWPGNVRELRNVLERCLIITRGNVSRVDLVGVPDAPPNEWSWSTSFPAGKSVDLVADELKSALILEALRRCKGRKQKAAELLNISRDALKRRIQGLGITHDRGSRRQSRGRLSPNGR